MELALFLKPLDVLPDFTSDQLGNRIVLHTEKQFPPLNRGSIALISVREFRGGAGAGCQHADTFIRDKLYKLYDHFPDELEISDWGYISAGERYVDTLFALKEVCSYLMKRQVLPIVFGGGQDLSLALYRSFDNLEQLIDMVVIDSRFNLDKVASEVLEVIDERVDELLNHHNYLLNLLAQRPSTLFNLSVIGIQSFFNPINQFELMKELYFDTITLGEARAQLEDCEIYLRSADLMVIDVAAIRHSDLPGQRDSSPNGFFGHEICALTRYGGLSDKMSLWGIFNYDPTLDDENGTSANSIAQMIWYFLEGFVNRLKDFPRKRSNSFTQYTTSIKSGTYELVFIKSNRSDRWWLEVTIPPGFGSKTERNIFVPCTYEDYKTACKEELPNIYWKYQQKYAY